MSLSNDDEDEFQSADEEGFDGDDDGVEAIEATTSELDGKQKLGDNKLVDHKDDRPTIEEPKIERSSSGQKLERSPSLSDIEKPDSKQTSTLNEDDEDERLAEQIRERNIKLARKFSAELAKSVKASAPIPVKTEPPIGFKVDDIEYPDIPDSDKKARQPLAPPPTPALSSSFSASEEHAASSSNAESSTGTQYGWRIPVKTQPKQQPDATTTPKESEINQARAALDRLSDNYTDTDKSLFQKVAEDLKKVSIKSDDPPVAEGPTQSSTSGSALPSLTSIGQSLGGWNWNNASRILKSASEVTSQVSSVLDSVVNAPRAGASQQASASTQVTQSTISQAPTSVSSGQSTSTTKASMSASEAMSNDALVDLTLNAMESLGKKAFGAMTHRDETGSLQIKGLGRPWEQLLNIAKPQTSEQSQSDNSRAQHSAPPNYSESEPIKIRDSDKDSDRKSSVRRRVVNYDDSDRLD